MVQFLRRLSKLLMIPPFGVFMYDLITQWTVHARFRQRPLEEWWKWLDEKTLDAYRPLAEKILTEPVFEKLLAWPAFFSLLLPPVLLYIVYWLLFRLRGGNRAGKITYKSPD